MPLLVNEERTPLFYYADESTVTTPLYVLPGRLSRSTTQTSQLVTILAQKPSESHEMTKLKHVNATYRELTSTQV